MNSPKMNPQFTNLIQFMPHRDPTNLPYITAFTECDTHIQMIYGLSGSGSQTAGKNNPAS